jgi:hypothetical protein
MRKAAASDVLEDLVRAGYTLMEINAILDRVRYLMSQCTLLMPEER